MQIDFGVRRLNILLALIYDLDNEQLKANWW